MKRSLHPQSSIPTLFCANHGGASLSGRSIATVLVVVHATLPYSQDLVEIGGQAVWSVTTAKAGNGVDLLRDNKEDTYWQSDGPQPHLISVQFQRKVIGLYTNCALLKMPFTQLMHLVASIMCSISLLSSKILFSMTTTTAHRADLLRRRWRNPTELKVYWSSIV